MSMTRSVCPGCAHEQACGHAEVHSCSNRDPIEKGTGMNRAQRRKAGIKKPEPTYNLNAQQLAGMKKEATNEAVHAAFILMLAIPAMVLHDKFGQLMPKEVGGKNREERFVDMCVDLYDSYVKVYVTLDDLREWLWDEANTKIEMT